MKSPLTEILSPFPVSKISISSTEFSRCAELARQHGVEMLFYSRLKKHYAGSKSFIDDYLKQNERSYLITVARSMRQEVVENQIIAALGKQGIPACIIKGNEIARSLYEDPNCRSSADIDVLVKKSDFLKADLILRNAHYTSDNKFLFADFMYHTHHRDYNDPVYNNLIELHWIFGVPYFFRLSSEEIWEKVVIGEGGHAKLSPEMLLVILLIHHHSHSFRELRVIVDILWAFYKYDQTINWPEFSATIKRLGLTKTILISIRQLDALWPERISSMQSIRTLKQLFIDMGCRTSGFLVSYFKMELGRSSELNFYMDKFVARFALDGLDTIFFSYLKTLFPPPEVIRQIYHSNANLMLPINYLRLICLRVKNWAGFTKI